MKDPSIFLVDTNFILRYLLADHPPFYAKAEAFFRQVYSGESEAVVLESVLAECVYVLTKFYQVPRAKAAEELARLLWYRGIANSDKEELLAALALYQAHGLDIVDCILLAKARQPGYSLKTFDKGINRRE